MGDDEKKRNEKDLDFERALEPVLGFYGTQLQSHAATIVSLAIGIFVLVSLKPSGTIGAVAFVLGSPFLGTVIAYSVLRLLAYGQLSKSILYGNWKTFDNIRKRLDYWNDIFPYTKVSHYVNSFLLEDWRAKKHFHILKGEWILDARAQPRMRLLLLIGLMSFGISLLFAVYG
jgi:hypothetical protein